ncbi:hypothetical protein QRX60_43300 [Amycolatopsis mongoliensis]|uniref:Uncharacterized protein n=1 Tax=Amycolatopsis mongoliensis TaxID=715475 RepID=A0A9Y2JPW0_9PSEU|nr:hypothetical protein [Amycolatopsis sp. 4-36]WIY00814.1 hypothetical protein QRX60_43300 [Amycolatopsis sp. 4-36]
MRPLLQAPETACLAQEHHPRRYRMHDLVRLHAAELAHRDLSEEDREAAALRRLIDFHLHTDAEHADLLALWQRAGPRSSATTILRS